MSLLIQGRNRDISIYLGKNLEERVEVKMEEVERKTRINRIRKAFQLLIMPSYEKSPILGEHIDVSFRITCTSTRPIFPLLHFTIFSS
jgi:hypothetical protein